MFVFCTPQVFVMIRSLRIWCMKKTKWLPWQHLLFVMIVEMLHTIGLSMLFYLVLPDLDSIRGMMLTHGVLFFPSVLKCISYIPFGSENTELSLKKKLFLAFDVAAVLIQFIGTFLWTILNATKDWSNWQLEVERSLLLPFSLIFISLGWWESFVDEKASNKISKYLRNIRRMMIQEGTRYVLNYTKTLKVKFIEVTILSILRYTTYLCVSICKITLFFFLMALAKPFVRISTNRF